MNATQRAIEDAIKAGYKPQHRAHFIKGQDHTIQIRDSFALDKNFWEALGRERGNRCKKCGLRVIPPGQYCEDEEPHPWASFDWKENWHALIDALASGTSIEEYFQSLEDNK